MILPALEQWCLSVNVLLCGLEKGRVDHLQNGGLNDVRFCLGPEKNAINAVFIMRTLQEGIMPIEKSCVCLIDMKKAFDRVACIVMQ